MVTPLLQMIGIGRRFEATGASILSDINLTISEGEFVCMLGPSGSGKSTLLSILGCLDRPSEGQLLIQGQDIWSLRPTKVDAIRARHVWLHLSEIRPHPRAQPPSKCRVAAVYARRPDVERQTLAGALIERFGLRHRAGQKPNLLSGGEQQRVAIARA